MSILLEVLGEQINILRRLQQLLRVSHVLVHFVYRPRCNRFHLVSLLHCKIYVLLTDSCAVVVVHLLKVWLENLVVNVWL